jgi:hypothetical protein
MYNPEVLNGTPFEYARSSILEKGVKRVLLIL